MRSRNDNKMQLKFAIVSQEEMHGVCLFALSQFPAKQRKRNITNEDSIYIKLMIVTFAHAISLNTYYHEFVISQRLLPTNARAF